MAVPVICFWRGTRWFGFFLFFGQSEKNAHGDITAQTEHADGKMANAVANVKLVCLCVLVVARATGSIDRDVHGIQEVLELDTYLTYVCRQGALDSSGWCKVMKEKEGDCV